MVFQLKKNNVIDLGFVPSHKEKKGKFAVEDFDNILTVNGQTAVEVDLDSLDDKPWRKPGADITDYFNYGFTEETWAAYCNRYTYFYICICIICLYFQFSYSPHRQRRMRVNESGVGLALTGQTPILTNNKVTSLGASSGAIPTLGAAPGTTAIQSLGAGAASGNGVNMTKILSGPPPSSGPPSVASIPAKKDEPSGITVMTHEKRIYSNKVSVDLDVVSTASSNYECQHFSSFSTVRFCPQWTSVFLHLGSASLPPACRRPTWRTATSTPVTPSTTTSPAT